MATLNVVKSGLYAVNDCNVVYNPAQSQFVQESAKPLCMARVVAVADDVKLSG